MKRRCDQVDERRRGLQLHAGEIAIAGEITLLQMTTHAKPIVGGLQWEMNVLGGFQFEDGQAPRAGDGKKIQDAVFAAGIGEDLGVDVARIKRGINAGDVLANERFEPALGLGAIKGMTCVAGQRMAVNLEFMEQALKRRMRRGGELFARIHGSEKNAAVIPAGERKAAKAKKDFARWNCRMHGYGLRCRGHDGFESGTSAIEERLRFAVRHEPTRKIAEGARIDFLERIAIGIVLVKLDGEARIKCGKTLRGPAAFTFWKNQTERRNGAAAHGLASSIEPQKRESEAIFHVVRRIALGHADHGSVRRATTKQAASIVAGKRMLEIRRDDQRFHSFVGELLRKESG